MKMYTVSDFDYALPDALIAQFPTQKRTESRLLVVPEKSDDFRHVLFPELLADLNPADLVIFNDTRVMNARLFGKKASGGKIECLIERVLDDHTALAHIKASHAPLVDSELILESVLHATVIARQGALFVLQFSNEESIAALLSQHGHLPLPPYIARDVKENDLERYQTVYSKNMGAVAAPTAGLHFDDLLLQTMREKKN